MSARSAKDKRFENLLQRRFSRVRDDAFRTLGAGDGQGEPFARSPPSFGNQHEEMRTTRPGIQGGGVGSAGSFTLIQSVAISNLSKFRPLHSTLPIRVFRKGLKNSAILRASHGFVSLSDWPAIVGVGCCRPRFGERGAERRPEHFPRGDEERGQDRA